MNRWFGALCGVLVVVSPTLAVLFLPRTRDRWVNGYRMDPLWWQSRPLVALGVASLLFTVTSVTACVLAIRRPSRTFAVGLASGAIIGLVLAGCGVLPLLDTLDTAGG